MYILISLNWIWWKSSCFNCTTPAISDATGDYVVYFHEICKTLIGQLCFKIYILAFRLLFLRRFDMQSNNLFSLCTNWKVMFVRMFRANGSDMRVKTSFFTLRISFQSIIWICNLVEWLKCQSGEVSVRNSTAKGVQI